MRQEWEDFREDFREDGEDFREDFRDVLRLAHGVYSQRNIVRDLFSLPNAMNLFQGS